MDKTGIGLATRNALTLRVHNMQRHRPAPAPFDYKMLSCPPLCQALFCATGISGSFDSVDSPTRTLSDLACPAAIAPGTLSHPAPQVAHTRTPIAARCRLSHPRFTGRISPVGSSPHERRHRSATPAAPFTGAESAALIQLLQQQAYHNGSTPESKAFILIRFWLPIDCAPRFPPPASDRWRAAMQGSPLHTAGQCCILLLT